MKIEIHHDLSGSKKNFLVRVNEQWKNYLKKKLDEKDIRILLKEQMIEELIGITITGANWIDYEKLDYAVYTDSTHTFRELAGLWKKEAYFLIAGHPNKYNETSDSELLMELMEEFKMDEVITKLVKYK